MACLVLKKWLTSFRCTMYFVFQEEERS